MILIGVGSNVPGPWGTPEETVARVGFELGRGPVRVERVSRPVRTTPFGVIEQPPFTNAALAIETDLPPRLGCFIFRRWSGGLAATGLRLKDDGGAAPCSPA
jgi:7,8-dihydro-6-hydroxymethylpterin-pyrophosphokinase